MKRSLLMMLLVLSACGGTAVDTSTPEALHDSWIAAVQAGDAALLETMMPPGMSFSPVLPDDSTQVEIIGVDGGIDGGADGEWYGKSTWGQVCYIATMQQVEEEWVVGIWREYPMEQCTE